MKHIHKFRRVDIGKDKPYWVMKCALVGCNHYTPMKSKLSCPRLKDEAAICNKCEEPFQLNRRALRMAQPTCDSCVVTKETKLTKAEEFFQSLELSIKS